MLPRLNKRFCPFRAISALQKVGYIKKAEAEKEVSINEAFRQLKVRKNREAMAIFEKVLLKQPGNLEALWGRAEVKRRMRQYSDAESILNAILKKNPQHHSALISLAYIKYKEDKLNEAQQLVNKVLEKDCPDRENEALAYLMLGTINSRRCAKSWFLAKIKYCTQMKFYFLKARALAPDLPEVRLGLGTFYLLAPAIAGGNLNQAQEELSLAVKMAPDFATANARLAQAYKKKGDLEKCNFYFQRARELDPENEALKELKGE